MMKDREIESWTLRLVDNVRASRPMEDGLAEAKRTWPDPLDAARQLAAHANATAPYGDAILWLIGIDQKGHAVPGASEKELATWWPQVKKLFDGDPPALLRNLNVQTDGVTIVALLFEASRAPYVVLVGGKRELLEVPWRSANGTRSARREDLLRLFQVSDPMPAFEILEAGLTERRAGNRSAWLLFMHLFVAPRTRDLVTIADHRCRAAFRIPGLRTFDVQPLRFFANEGPDGIIATGTSVSIPRPGVLGLNGELNTEMNLIGASMSLEAVVTLVTARGAQATIVQPLHPVAPASGDAAAVAAWGASPIQ